MRLNRFDLVRLLLLLLLLLMLVLYYYYSSTIIFMCLKRYMLHVFPYCTLFFTLVECEWRMPSFVCLSMHVSGFITPFGRFCVCFSVSIFATRSRPNRLVHVASAKSVMHSSFHVFFFSSKLETNFKIDKCFGECECEMFGNSDQNAVVPRSPSMPHSFCVYKIHRQSSVSAFQFVDDI